MMGLYTWVSCSYHRTNALGRVLMMCINKHYSYEDTIHKHRTYANHLESDDFLDCLIDALTGKYHDGCLNAGQIFSVRNPGQFQTTRPIFIGSFREENISPWKIS